MTHPTPLEQFTKNIESTVVIFYGDYMEKVTRYSDEERAQAIEIFKESHTNPNIYQVCLHFLTGIRDVFEQQDQTTETFITNGGVEGRNVRVHHMLSTAMKYLTLTHSPSRP